MTGRSYVSTLSTLYHIQVKPCRAITTTYARLTTVMCIKQSQCCLPTCTKGYGCEELDCSPSVPVLVLQLFVELLLPRGLGWDVSSTTCSHCQMLNLILSEYNEQVQQAKSSCKSYAIVRACLYCLRLFVVSSELLPPYGSCQGLLAALLPLTDVTVPCKSNSPIAPQASSTSTSTCTSEASAYTYTLFCSYNHACRMECPTMACGHIISSGGM